MEVYSEVILHPPLFYSIVKYQFGLTHDLHERLHECQSMEPISDWDQSCHYRLPQRYHSNSVVLELQHRSPLGISRVPTWISELGNEHHINDVIVTSNALFLHGYPSAYDLAFHLAILEGNNLLVKKWIDYHGISLISVSTLDFCARLNSWEILSLLRATSGLNCSSRGVDAAAKHGHLTMLKELFNGVTTSTGALDGAALHGHFEVVEYLHSQHAPCTTLAMSGAASNGHLKIVQYLHNHRSEGCTKWAMDGAARNGFIDVVSFLHYNRYEGCTEAALNDSAARGHLAIVKFLVEHRPNVCSIREAIAVARRRRHLDVVNYLHQQNLSRSKH